VDVVTLVALLITELIRALIKPETVTSFETTSTIKTTITQIILIVNTLEFQDFDLERKAFY
jgi:hypothetical protein